VRCFLLIVGLTTAVCACQASPEEEGAADTAISIQTTDVESLSLGGEALCVERLTKVVDADYLRRHEIEIVDEGSATLAVEDAIEDVCARADAHETVHEAAHEVVHEVEERLK
jgi:hypothetical protein